MRNIGTLPAEGPARKFGDYLYEQGMPNTVEPASEGWAVWVHDDNHLDRAAKELERFRDDPDHEKYRHASEAAAALRKDEAGENRRYAKRMINVRSSWSGPLSSGRRITTILILLSVGFGLFTGIDILGGPLAYYLLFGVPNDGMSGFGLILGGQVWRLFSSMFLHGGMLHLLFNMLWLYYLGGQVESVKGRRFMLVFVLVTQTVVSVGQNLASGPLFGGMSGVNYALFGYIYFKMRYEPHLGFMLSPWCILIMMGWLLVGVTSVVTGHQPGQLGRTAHTAHYVGLVAGMVTGGWRTLWLWIRGKG